MTPFFSIVIPYHNSSKTIKALLDSIKHSVNVPPLEVIIIDDGSREKVSFASTGNFISSVKPPLHWKTMFSGVAKLNIRSLSLKANIGPAGARNRGAKMARGKFLVFLDSDVVLFPDALHNLWKIYEDDPDIVAVTGVWVKQQKTKAFFPNFKALRDWSYWTNERDTNMYYYLFSTRIASIKRAVFQRLKGFDESYTSALVEDIEFTYRIARRYAVIFAPTVRVHHEFENFLPIAKKYFWRTYHWTKLFSKRKKFDPVATTFQEAMSALSGAGLGIAIILLWLSILFAPTFTVVFPWFPFVLYGFGAFIGVLTLIHCFFVRTFLLFVLREKGIVFALKSFIVGICLYMFITAGAVWGRIK